MKSKLYVVIVVLLLFVQWCFGGVERNQLLGKWGYSQSENLAYYLTFLSDGRVYFETIGFQDVQGAKYACNTQFMIGDWKVTSSGELQMNFKKPCATDVLATAGVKTVDGGLATGKRVYLTIETKGSDSRSGIDHEFERLPFIER